MYPAGMTRSQDTSPEAHQQQLAAYRRMGPERRLLLALSMSDDGRAVAAAGIKSRHPANGEDEVRDALHRLLLGDTLFRAAWPGRPLLEP